MNSRDKGKRGELEAAKAWADTMGGRARRGQQYSGGKDSPDIVHDFPRIHLEAKRCEKGNPYQWIDQAAEDAAYGQVPVVLHRRNNREWLLIVRLFDVPRFVLEAFAGPQVPALGSEAVPGNVPDQGQRSSVREDG